MLDSRDACGLIFVMVGPGGAGKNAIMQALIAADAGIRQLPTATTRPMRANEKHGREHLFVSRRRLIVMIPASAVSHQGSQPSPNTASVG